MASTCQTPLHQSSLELLKNLPPEILDRALFLYCDGKTLSTLALALSSSCCLHYRNIAYETIPNISKRLLLRIIDEIKSSDIDGFAHVGVLRWIRSIAEDSDIILQVSGESQRQDNFSKDDNFIHGRTASQLCGQEFSISRKMIHYSSENLAVVDFLRRSMKESIRGKWEWPVWVGQISVSISVDATVARTMTHVVVLAPFEFPSHMPGSSLLYRHRTPTSLFRCEPMNMIPLPPWGRLRGLTANDEVALNRIALRLEEAGESHVAVPTESFAQDPLNIRILSKKGARRRFLRVTSQLVRNRLSKLMWLIRDTESVDDGNNTDVAAVNYPNSLELVCCWENNTYDEILPREYIEYVILLMKTRDRLTLESSAA